MKKNIFVIITMLLMTVTAFAAVTDISKQTGPGIADIIVANNTYYSTENTKGSEPGPEATFTTLKGVGGKEATDNSVYSVIPAIEHGENYVKGNNHKQYFQVKYTNSNVGEGFVVFDVNIMPMNEISAERISLQPNAGTSVTPIYKQSTGKLLNVGKWNHVRVVMQPSTGNSTDGYGYSYIYINGELAKEGRSGNTYNSSYAYPKRLMFDATAANDSTDIRIYFDDFHAYISDANPGAQTMPEINAAEGYTAENGIVTAETGIKVSDISSDYTVRAYADDSFEAQLAEDDFLCSGNVIVAENGVYITYYTVEAEVPYEDFSVGSTEVSKQSRTVSFANTAAWFGEGARKLMFVAASYKDGRVIETDIDAKTVENGSAVFKTKLKEVQGAEYKGFFLDAETLSPVSEETQMGKNSLDGKKIIFIGNSLVYYGQVVLNKSSLAQSVRVDDKGYFYELCRQNGMDVSVTNWTFGSHTLVDTFGGSCAAGRDCDGHDHLADLKDRNYDYVVISSGSWEDEENFAANLEMVMKVFRDVNPDTKFVLLSHHRNYTLEKYNLLNQLKDIAESGITVVDWGSLVMDIINGDVSVPGAVQSYNQNSFIVQKSAADGYHPNILTGYITTLMTYCAITGESAVSQPYAFCSDTSINSKYSFDDYVSTYYCYDNAVTNFPDVFASKSDMAGIQTLIDRYLNEARWKTYNFTVE